MSELVSLIKRMTKEVKEIGECIEKNSEEMRDFFRKKWAALSKTPLYFYNIV